MEQRLRIPKPDQAPLARLLSLSDTDFDSLITALENSPPSLRRADLRRAIQGKTSLSKEEEAGILRVALSLFSVRAEYRLDAEELLEQLCQAAKLTGREDLKLENNKYDLLKARLRRLLTLERTVGVTSKALSVALEHKYLLHEARIVTDVRPVFSSSATEPPAAWVVNHVLRLQCHRDGSDEENIMVALNSDDLKRLAEVIERAQTKEQTVRKTMTSCGIPFLTFGED